MDLSRLHAETDPAQRATMMNKAATPGLDAKMGITFTHIAADRCIGSMPVAGNNQPFGILHGGANAVLAESLASIASLFLLSENQIAVGLQVQMTHHAAAKSGFVTGTATLIHSGRSIATYLVEIIDETGKLTSSGQVICFLKR
jgi:uncharacterized protein (TIGR00369 family)